MGGGKFEGVWDWVYSMTGIAWSDALDEQCKKRKLSSVSPIPRVEI